MDGDRLRVVVADEYIASLGRAVYAFSLLEWNIIWCLERMVPSDIGSVSRKMSMQISKKFSRISQKILDSNLRDQCITVSTEFELLVKKRNALLHAKPGTATDGSQLLFRNGNPWTISAIDALADEFAALSIKANALLHGSLNDQSI